MTPRRDDGTYPSGAKKTVCLKIADQPKGLPCRRCGTVTKSREYDPRKEPSPYTSFRRRPQTLKQVGQDLAKEQTEEEEES